MVSQGFDMLAIFNICLMTYLFARYAADVHWGEII